MGRKERVAEWNEKSIEELASIYLNLSESKFYEDKSIPEWVLQELRDMRDFTEKSVFLVSMGEVDAKEVIEGLLDWYDDEIEAKYGEIFAAGAPVMYMKAKLKVAEWVHIKSQTNLGFFTKKEGEEIGKQVLSEAVRSLLIYGIYKQQRDPDIADHLEFYLRKIGMENEAKRFGLASLNRHKGQFN